jgi:hypothetical protein
MCSARRLKQAQSIPDPAARPHGAGRVRRPLFGPHLAPDAEPGMGAYVRAREPASRPCIRQPRAFWPWIRAGAGRSGRPPGNEAGNLELDSERAKALSLLVRDMAALDPAEAERALRTAAPSRRALAQTGSQGGADPGRGGPGSGTGAYMKPDPLQRPQPPDSAPWPVWPWCNTVSDPRLGAPGLRPRCLSLAAELGYDLAPPEILARAAHAVRGRDAIRPGR